MRILRLSSQTWRIRWTGKGCFILSWTSTCSCQNKLSWNGCTTTRMRLLLRSAELRWGVEIWEWLPRRKWRLLPLAWGGSPVCDVSKADYEEGFCSNNDLRTDRWTQSTHFSSIGCGCRFTRRPASQRLWTGLSLQRRFSLNCLHSGPPQTQIGILGWQPRVGISISSRWSWLFGRLCHQREREAWSLSRLESNEGRPTFWEIQVVRTTVRRGQDWPEWGGRPR